MDIGFTEEQELLRTSARRFLENECPSAFVPWHRERVARLLDIDGRNFGRLREPAAFFRCADIFEIIRGPFLPALDKHHRFEMAKSP